MQGQGRSPACCVARGITLSQGTGCACGREKEPEASHEDQGGEERALWKHGNLHPLLL